MKTNDNAVRLKTYKIKNHDSGQTFRVKAVSYTDAKMKYNMHILKDSITEDADMRKVYFSSTVRDPYSDRGFTEMNKIRKAMILCGGQKMDQLAGWIEVPTNKVEMAKTLLNNINTLKNIQVKDSVEDAIWNPDFYLKKEPQYEEARNAIKQALWNASLTPAEITLSVYGSIIRFNDVRFNKNVKLDTAQMKTLVDKVLAKINPSLKAEKFRSIAGKITFEITGYEYLQKHLKDSITEDAGFSDWLDKTAVLEVKPQIDAALSSFKKGGHSGTKYDDYSIYLFASFGPDKFELRYYYSTLLEKAIPSVINDKTSIVSDLLAKFNRITGANAKLEKTGRLTSRGKTEFLAKAESTGKRVPGNEYTGYTPRAVELMFKKEKIDDIVKDSITEDAYVYPTNASTAMAASFAKLCVEKFGGKVGSKGGNKYVYIAQDKETANKAKRFLEEKYKTSLPTVGFIVADSITEDADIAQNDIKSSYLPEDANADNIQYLGFNEKRKLSFYSYGDRYFVHYDLEGRTEEIDKTTVQKILKKNILGEIDENDLINKEPQSEEIVADTFDWKERGDR